MPSFWQCFVTDPAGTTGIDLDRKLFVLRKRIEHEIAGDLPIYFPSLSSRTLVYKGMLTTPQLAEFFPDLRDPRIESALALVHSRFSTNTFPSWPLAHPYRFVAHNGEINTVQGNRNWMRARPAQISTPLIPDLETRVPDHHGRLVGHDELRRVPRAAAPRRALAGALGADDDPGGVGEPCDDVAREARVLSLSRIAHGAVGRPRIDRLHRWHASSAPCSTGTACARAATG